MSPAASIAGTMKEGKLVGTDCAPHLGTRGLLEQEEPQDCTLNPPFSSIKGMGKTALPGRKNKKIHGFV